MQRSNPTVINPFSYGMGGLTGSLLSAMSNGNFFNNSTGTLCNNWNVAGGPLIMDICVGGASLWVYYFTESEAKTINTIVLGATAFATSTANVFIPCIPGIPQWIGPAITTAISLPFVAKPIAEAGILVANTAFEGSRRIVNNLNSFFSQPNPEQAVEPQPILRLNA